MPSLKEEYGALTEPVWDLEYGVLNLRDTLQKYVDLLCPDAEYTVVGGTKDLVYECVCSGVSYRPMMSTHLYFFAGSLAPLCMA